MKHTMLIYVSSEGNGKGGNTGNNNKFYYAELKENDDVIARYGRVGDTGTQITKASAGLKGFNKLIKAKVAKGYTEVPIDLSASDIEINTPAGQDVMLIALSQINSDEFSKELIKKLVERNIHNITSNTKITFNKSTGLFKTPLGVVTKEGVDKALDLLDQIVPLVDEGSLFKTNESAIRRLSEQYYSIIPTILHNLRSISGHIIKSSRLEQQRDICNALLQSLDIIKADRDKTVKEAVESVALDTPKLFNTSLVKLDDDAEFDRISKYFEESKNRQHGTRTSGASIKTIYKINIESDDKAYRKDLNNQMELWHGTKVVNILSILKSGLLMPKYSPGVSTGYMFGQGLYFAKQSSKSLNYCDGMYYNSSSRTDNKIYMFVADIAMGNFQVPKGCKSVRPDKGYDSYWAKPGQSGIQNDEMIVFDNNQIKLKYLLEIELKG